MSWILPTTLAFAIAFACIAGLCEWLGRRLHRRSETRRGESGFRPEDLDQL